MDHNDNVDAVDEEYHDEGRDAPSLELINIDWPVQSCEEKHRVAEKAEPILVE